MPSRQPAQPQPGHRVVQACRRSPSANAVCRCAACVFITVAPAAPALALDPLRVGSDAPSCASALSPGASVPCEPKPALAAGSSITPAGRTQQTVAGSREMSDAPSPQPLPRPAGPSSLQRDSQTDFQVGSHADSPANSRAVIPTPAAAGATAPIGPAGPVSETDIDRFLAEYGKPPRSAVGALLDPTEKNIAAMREDLLQRESLAAYIAERMSDLQAQVQTPDDGESSDTYAAASGRQAGSARPPGLLLQYGSLHLVQER